MAYGTRELSAETKPSAPTTLIHNDRIGANAIGTLWSSTAGLNFISTMPSREPLTIQLSPVQCTPHASGLPARISADRMEL